ncbi:6-phosphogluconate dehydrogenase C-terminal domain-like protein [Melanomma pulvis-pyrius CBS 109.77]|uniref:6-phosphogluconate dehydrogenase C-terminal domain-like protein n=1 Tax=Melanomma pulvis-pyrius CBS 109.77 TaxID=1314802 RepID=A0A6A6XB53_9PLEO|nr:6-phosphogluconate dehydrogenase C-terminal domain-like protein [Melanomma pulvis-pyrius CBS 109.77]
MATPQATVGILSIGQMGLGIAKLLVAHDYRVLTNVANRSQATQERAQNAQLGLVSTDVELVAKCDYILSIVPPRDAVATAGRVMDALNSTPAPRSSSSLLYYLDLNAISPATVGTIAEAFDRSPQKVLFVDGGIIGGPPVLSADSSTWTRPGIPLSGPHPLQEAPLRGAHLASTLNSEYIGARIGSASGLKCCFAALSKGMTALAIQSFSTAASLDVLPHLQSYLRHYNPRGAEAAERGIVGCPQKAYRWVEEMNQIGQCFSEDGGWAEQAQVFRQIAGVYEGLATVVERRGGTEGMGNLDGAIGALQEGLKVKKRSRRLSIEELEQDDR